MSAQKNNSKKNNNINDEKKTKNPDGQNGKDKIKPTNTSSNQNNKGKSNNSNKNTKKNNNNSQNKNSGNSQNKSNNKTANQNKKNSSSKKIDTNTTKTPDTNKNKVDKSTSKKNEVKSKEEEIVFKDNKSTTKSVNNKSKSKTNSKKVEETAKEKVVDEKKKENNKNEKKEEKNEVVNKINTEEFFEEKKNKKRKVLFVLIVILIIFAIAVCFSTIFAILGSFKSTIARGVSIDGVDLSNLTYNEAKEKMIEAINVELTPDIELIYNDYTYTIKTSDIEYEYNINEALEKAYNVGKTGNIIQNNYTLIKTALFGEKIEISTKYDEDALNAIIDIIDTNIPGRVKQYSHYIDGANLIINPGSDGVKVQTEELKKQIISSIQNRDYNTIIDNYDSVKMEIPYKNIKADKIDAIKISEEIYTEPQNAYYVEETETTEFEIYPAKDGVAFAISTEEAQKIIDSEEKNEYIIPLTITEAEIQLNDIGVEAFPYKIQTFSTRYDASNYSRSENLRIAASKINGTVLLPGEVFSFNNVVGERTVAEGYKNAKIYSNGQVVDGLAGGICQISSTLYNVVLLSNLEIVERYNHSFTTSYVAAGRDATVVYGIKDFKFKNTRNYPIKIEASVANGVATFSIYGIKETDEYTVKIIPKTTQTTPYTTQTIVDNTLAPGTMKVTQGGASGCKVTTYKEVYLNGNLVSNEILSNDVYQVMTRIVRVGPTVETIPETGDTNITQ